jgi:tetratricopeptide (TPR) repeat protein
MTVRIRIPEWSKKTTLKVNGEMVQDVKSGSYATIQRQWKSGDAITLSLDLRSRLLRTGKQPENLAILRGPIVPSRDSRMSDLVPDAWIKLGLNKEGYVDISLTAREQGAYWMQFALTGRAEMCREESDAPRQIIFCDYSSAGNTYDEHSRFRSWYPQMLDPTNMNNRNFQIKKSSRNSFFPIPIYAKFHLANLYQNTNRHEMSEKQLKEIIAIQLNIGPAYRQLGGLYATKGDSVWSKFYSARTSDLVPYAAPADTLIDKLTKISRSEEILMKQIDLAIRSTNSQWADDLLVGGLKYFSDNKYFVSKAIKQFLNTGMYENALGLVDRHLRFFADDYNEMITLGSQFADAGLIPQAKRYVIKAQSITTQKADNLSALALMMFEKLRMTEESLSLMNELLEKNPDDLPVLINAAYLFHETNDQQQSSQLMAKLNQKAAAHPKVIALRGIIAEQNGKLAEAILLFEQSFKTDPRERYIIDHLGMIYLRDKMWSKAIDHYRKALAIYPNNATIQENLGGLLVACPEASLRNVKEGVEYSERAFINYEYTVPIRISAGRTVSIGYDQLGERSKAVYFITNTLEFARKVHVLKDYLKNLEDLAKEFSVPK